MSPGRVPTEAAGREAVGLLPSAVEGGGDIFDGLSEIRLLHPKIDTFPGEVFIGLAADALDEGGISPDRPISEEGLIGRYLPE